MSRCEQCEAFDAETKRRLTELFSVDELCFLTYLIGASLRHQITASQKPTADIKARMQARVNVDFASAVAGKFLMGFEEPMRDQVCAQIKKDHKIALNITHQKCPHGEVLPASKELLDDLKVAQDAHRHVP